MTQTTNNGVAQVAKRPHATAMSLSFEDDPTCLVVSSLKIYSKKKLRRRPPLLKDLKQVSAAETRN